MSENYLIIGDDEYISRTEANKIKERFLSPGEYELNYSVCGPDSIGSIMDSVGTVPFLAKKRVVQVSGAQELFNRFPDTILSYLEDPSENSVLVLMFPKAFQKNKHYAKLSKLVKIIKADKPDGLTIKKWIRSFFAKESVEISSGAVDLIVELKGTATVEVKMELEKILAFSGGQKIEVEHVEQLVGRSVRETVFKLVDAINEKNSKWAFSILDDLYHQKKQPHEIIGYLGWYVRVMQKIALLSSRGVDFGGIAAELGYSLAYVRRLSGQTKKYSIDQIGRWASLLFETDRDIKTGRRQSGLALETLLVLFLNGGRVLRSSVNLYNK